MKGLALIILCVAVAAQARHTGVEERATALANPGENPWLVHLFVVQSTSNGFPTTCVGSLIDARLVLTAADCVRNSRFIWVRYGVVDVYRPTLVTEGNNIVTIHASGFAIINVGRHVLNPYSPFISTAVLADQLTATPASATLCGFGITADGNPGRQLSCGELYLSNQLNNQIGGQSDSFKASRFDLGAPLVRNGVQYGVLTSASNAAGEAGFLNIAPFRHWIQSTTGVLLPLPSNEQEA